MDQSSALLLHFGGLLNDGIVQAKELNELLDKEYQSLQQVDPEPLEHITLNKQQLLSELESLSKVQDQFLTQLGYSTDRKGIESCLDQLGDDSQLKQKWHALQSLLENCQKQNEINGRVIAVSRRQTTIALDLLYGLTTGSKTYGPTGESQTDRQSNSLGKA